VTVCLERLVVSFIGPFEGGHQKKFKAWDNLPAIKELNAVRLKTAKSRAFMVEGLPNQ
jgi:hypothetical protein